MGRVNLRTLIVAVAFLALLLALIVQTWRAAERERELKMLLETTRMQMIEERDRVERFLRNAVITVAPGAADPAGSGSPRVAADDPDVEP